MVDTIINGETHNVRSVFQNGVEYTFPGKTDEEYNELMSQYNVLLEKYNTEFTKGSFWRKGQTVTTSNTFYNSDGGPTIRDTWDGYSRDGSVYHIFTICSYDIGSRNTGVLILHTKKDAGGGFSVSIITTGYSGYDWSSASMAERQYGGWDGYGGVRAKYSGDKDIEISFMFYSDYIGNYWAGSKWETVGAQYHAVSGTGAVTTDGKTHYFSDYPSKGVTRSSYIDAWIANCGISDSERISKTGYIESLSFTRDSNRYTPTYVLK